MAYRNLFILGTSVLLGFFFVPTWQGGQHALTTTPTQTTAITRSPTPPETITPSPSANPTLTPTQTNSPTLAPTPTLDSPIPSPTSPLPPLPCPCPVYLPLIFAVPSSTLLEIEPNNTFSQAQSLPIIPVIVTGTHDGATDTGDVFQTDLTAGQIIHITLTTDNPTGVQLLAYNVEPPAEIVRDFEVPFELTFLAIATGTYFLYVFTPGDVNNTGAYTLSVAFTTETP